MNIYVIEPNAQTREEIRQLFTNAGHEVTGAVASVSSLEAVPAADLVVLSTSSETYNEANLRALSTRAPIIAITGHGRDRPREARRFPNTGNVSFMHLKDAKYDLMVYANTLFRRAGKFTPAADKTIAPAAGKIKHIAFDDHSLDVKIDDHIIRLTETEARYFRTLANNRDTIVTNEELRIHNSKEVDSKIVDVIICKIRKKIDAVLGKGEGQKLIHTFWGIGYVLHDKTEYNPHQGMRIMSGRLKRAHQNLSGTPKTAAAL